MYPLFSRPESVVLRGEMIVGSFVLFCVGGYVLQIPKVGERLHRVHHWWSRLDLELIGSAVVVLVCAVLVVALYLWIQQRRGRPARHVDRVRAYLHERGLDSLPLLDGKPYPTKLSPDEPLWPGPRKPPRPRVADPHGWEWVVAEHMLIAAAFALFAPTVLMALGQTGGASEGVSLLRTWFAVAAEWWPFVLAAGGTPTVLYAGLRLRTWGHNRHRRSVRARRRARQRRLRTG